MEMLSDINMGAFSEKQGAMECDIIEKTVYRTTCKGQVNVQMYIICHSEKFVFNIDKIVEAITKASKATLNRMNTRITKEIQQLLDLGDNSLEDFPHSQWLYERIAELERMRKYIKLLKKMKSNKVPAKLRSVDEVNDYLKERGSDLLSQVAA